MLLLVVVAVCFARATRPILCCLLFHFHVLDAIHVNESGVAVGTASTGRLYLASLSWCVALFVLHAKLSYMSVVTEVEYRYLFSGTSDVGNIIQRVVVRSFTLLWYRA
jgi:lipoprotein signal peptidase